jgi:hypothetical protein
MRPLRLDDPASLPPSFAAKLADFDQVFQRCEYADILADDRGLRRLGDELETYLRTQPIYAYHCSREPEPGYFHKHGLRLTNLQTHQEEFLARFGERFTSGEIADMREAWRRHFVQGGQVKYREGMIWFCLTRETAYSSGTEVFFKYFGGEAVFMPLKRHPTIAKKLSQIGAPVVVEVRLPPGVASAHRPLSLPLLSAYHRTRRTDACPWLAETHVRQPVLPADVVAVTPV